MKNKLCPIISLIGEVGWQNCISDGCAWFCHNTKSCGIVALSSIEARKKSIVRVKKRMNKKAFDQVR